MCMIGRIRFLGLGIVLVGWLSGTPVFAGDKHNKHIAGESKVMITSPKDGDKVSDSFELKYELSNGSHGGHAHVFVDDDYQRGFHGTIKGLSKGEHQITVKAADKEHEAVTTIHTITVDVQ